MNKGSLESESFRSTSLLQVDESVVTIEDFPDESTVKEDCSISDVVSTNESSSSITSVNDYVDEIESPLATDKQVNNNQFFETVIERIKLEVASYVDLKLKDFNVQNLHNAFKNTVEDTPDVNENDDCYQLNELNRQLKFLHAEIKSKDEIINQLINEKNAVRTSPLTNARNKTAPVNSRRDSVSESNNSSEVSYNISQDDTKRQTKENRTVSAGDKGDLKVSISNSNEIVEINNNDDVDGFTPVSMKSKRVNKGKMT